VVVILLKPTPPNLRYKHEMKLRFSLRVLLAIPLVTGCAITWYTWPDRTFNAFKTSLENDRFELANSIVENSVSTFPDGSESPCTFLADSTGIHLNGRGGNSTTNPQYFISKLIPENRSFGDVLQAKRVYRVREYSHWGGRRHNFSFVVQRGQVMLEFNYGQ